ncbi:hypothetical protein B0H16DRAFT_1693984 [Mycena metata]|uniref:Uncharacterized protein n=1 Tax=Mycena metata TaxID=1033252 RepID=A0AAD7N1A1_9AGAR|nr:hypothetical protein B0H16DRAFT_1693984 [Mycena metata]
MTRAKKNIPPGQKSDFTGEKAEWLDSFKDTILGAGRDEIRAEYTDIANRFVLRYGYDLPFSDNVVGDPTLNPPVIPVAVTEEEKTRREEIRATLRTKLSNWYRTRYRNKKANGAALKQILGAMQGMAGNAQRPRRKAVLAMYWKLHYEERVKPAFDAMWANTKDSVPITMRVSMMQDYVRSCWEAESEEFKKGVEDQCSRVHEEAMKKWRAGRLGESFTAEEYNDALESMEDVVIPLADALAESVFSDTAEGAISKMWAQFDHLGFTATEASITRYGNAFFTTPEQVHLSRKGPVFAQGLIAISLGNPY